MDASPVLDESRGETEGREFVVDSGASMHMLGKKDLNSAELETMRVSQTPVTVNTANGEVQTKEEATVHVKGLDLFVTVAPQRYTSSALAWKNFAKNTDILTSGPVVNCNIW